MSFNALEFLPFETEIFSEEDFLASSVTNHSLIYEATQKEEIKGTLQCFFNELFEL